MLDTVTLGDKTGLKVPKLCLGTMNFGEPGRGHQGDWTLDYKEAKKGLIKSLEKFDNEEIDYFGGIKKHDALLKHLHSL